MTFEVKVRRLFNDDKPLKAYCSVTMDGKFAVHNVRVVKTDKGEFIAMPAESYKDKDGKEIHRDVFHPINAEARKEMADAVLAAYEAKAAENDNQ